jgi:hypothetical protein
MSLVEVPVFSTSPKLAKSLSVGSFSVNVGLGRVIFSFNVGMKLRCSRAEQFMFSGCYSY